MERTWYFKSVLLGEGAVGKTSIRRKYMREGFKTRHIPTLGVDFSKKLIDFYGEIVQFIIWDLAGQPSFERVRRHYYQGCQSLILVYSVVDRGSFDNSLRWLTEAYKHMGELPPTAIVANKVDLRPSTEPSSVVTTEEGMKFSQHVKRNLEVPIVFKETSALTGENIEEVFTDLLRFMIIRAQETP
ncbi:MAG: Rab family GTPase [Candidatus Thorarchaeota archaeon]|jgi:small GTP-binding protein